MSEISILGIEGTAWNLSTTIVDENDVLAETTATYRPAAGGIHPREAAQHHGYRRCENPYQRTTNWQRLIYLDARYKETG
jgi:tRNA A37 threonylcarbamoyltransferase TsaD